MKQKLSSFFKNHKNVWIDLAVLFGLFLFIIISYLAFKPYYWVDQHEDGFYARIYTYALLFGWVVTVVFLYKYTLIPIAKAASLPAATGRQTSMPAAWRPASVIAGCNPARSSGSTWPGP